MVFARLISATFTISGLTGALASPETNAYFSHALVKSMTLESGDRRRVEWDQELVLTLTDDSEVRVQLHELEDLRRLGGCGYQSASRADLDVVVTGCADETRDITLGGHDISSWTLSPTGEFRRTGTSDQHNHLEDEVVVPHDPDSIAMAEYKAAALDHGGFSLTADNILQYNGGYVCDDSFDETAARMVCGLLGMDLANYQGRVRVPSADYTMDDLTCELGATSLGDCTFSSTHDCGSSEGVELNCAAWPAGTGSTPAVRIVVDYYYDRTFVNQYNGDHDQAKLAIRSLHAHTNVRMGQHTIGRVVVMEIVNEITFVDAEKEANGNDLSWYTQWLNENEDRCRTTTADGRFIALRHLLTAAGSDSTAGIAYVGTICHTQCYNSGITEYSTDRNVGYTSVLMAHEMGHNLGMQHTFDSSNAGRNCEGYMSYDLSDFYGWSECAREDWAEDYDAYINVFSEERIEGCFAPFEIADETPAPTPAPGPTTEPTSQPTDEPTAEPTARPTSDTQEPTASPTAEPTATPTMEPGVFSIDANGALMFGNGYVCDDSFGRAEASMVCATLGADRVVSYLDARISGDFTMDDLDCPSGATALAECTYTSQHNCASYEGVALTCRTTSATPFTIDANGVLMFEEGYVCDDGFGVEEATMVCATLGLGYLSHSARATISGPDFTMDDLACPPGAESLDLCTWTDLHNCGSSEAVSLSCGTPADTSAPTPTPTNAPTEPAQTGEPTQTPTEPPQTGEPTQAPTEPAQTGEPTQTPTEPAQTGEPTQTPTAEPQTDEPTAEPTQNPTSGQTGGFSIDENGFLMFGNGYVCDDNFGTEEAALACATLGLRMVTFRTRGPVGLVDFSMDELECPLGATSLEECTYTSEHDCTSIEGVRLTCAPRSEDEFSINADGVLMFGEGYVCDDYFGDKEGAMVCATLGLEYKAHGDARTSGDYVMDNLQCPPGASSLDHCTYIEDHNCGRSEGVGLSCGAPETPVFSLDTNGALMFVDGYVCDDDFDEFAGRMICGTFGQSFVSWSPIQLEDNNFSMDELNCEEGAESLDDCRYTVTHDCGAAEGVELICGAPDANAN